MLMKRLLSLAVLFTCCITTSFALDGYSGAGEGTEKSPFLIYHDYELNELRYFLNKEGKYFKLMDNIDLTDFLEDESPDQGWQPIGNSSSAAFKGILDGNGKTISGLWIKRGNTDYVGLFGYTQNATISNLTVVANTIEGKNNVGGIAGYSPSSNFDNVKFEGTLKGGSEVGGIIGNTGGSVSLTGCVATVAISGSDNNIGGLVGYGSCTLSNCQVNNSTISGKDYVGGACGNSNGSFSFCYIHANIVGSNRIGGVCGSIDNCNMNNCGFIGNITGAMYVGGLTGYCTTARYNSGSITNCFALGNIYASDNYSGGLFGYESGYNGSSYANISDCYFSGSVSGQNYTAGLVGYKKYGTISKCYSMASVAGAKYVGGLVGYNESGTTLKTSVAINTRVTATEGEVARIVGQNKGTIATVGSPEENKSYNRTIVISQGVACDIVDDALNGTGVSANTLKRKATYVSMDWDFSGIWSIQETECYPYFKTQTAPPIITSNLVSGATNVSGKCIDGGTLTLEVDGAVQKTIANGNTFSFNVNALQAGHDVRISAKAEGKEQSYYTIQTVSYIGKGTESDPYQVYTASDLTGVYRKGYFILMRDIDLTSYINQFSPTEGWESIGREGSETIHFDGNGHKITGLWCNSTRKNTGLFSCFANGTIKNLTVEVANGKQVKGGTNTGILIGKMMNGTIENCRVFGDVANVVDGAPVGGLVGLLDGGTITLSQASVNIVTTGESSYVGGLVGEITNTGGEIDQCLTTGSLTATGVNSYLGGLVGKNYATITNCYSTAQITSTYCAAGVVAYNYGLVDKCYATGDLYSDCYSAGIIDLNDGENAVVKNCVAMNNKIIVGLESQQYAGGSYASRILGNFINNAPEPEKNNYALGSMMVSENNNPRDVKDDALNGVAKTNEELKAQETYQSIEWSMSTIWNIDEGISYPYLRHNVVSTTSNPDPDNPNPGGGQEIPDDIDVTDISTYSDAIYAKPSTSLKGGDGTLTICMKNAQTTCGYSYELKLPEGVSLVKDTENDFLYELSSRHNGHSATVNYNETTGVYSFAVLSLQSKEIKDNDGTIWTLYLKVANDVPVGNYAVKIQNAKYSLTSGSGSVTLPEAISQLTIEDFIKGDANGDGVIDIADAVCIVNHVVGKPTPAFVAKAADVNGDGDVDIADAVRIVNLVVGKISALAPKFGFALPEPE